MRMVKFSLLLVACSFAISACATVSQGKFTTTHAPDEVFRAAQLAASKSGFGITQADQKSGFLSGSQGVVMGNGTATIISVQLHPTRKGSELDVSIVPPPGTIGDTSSMLKSFENELSSQITDLASKP